MSLQTAQARLNDASRQLRLQWTRIGETWRDPQSKAFQKQQMEPLEADLRQAQAAMNQMNEVLNRATRDCAS